jgi:uncharacterized membrane protein
MTMLTEPLGDGRRITLVHHRSLSWRQAKWLFAGFAGCMAVSSVYWAAKGAWLVVPFFGLELIVLGLGLYLCARAGARREVIEIDGPALRLSWGRSALEGQLELPRHWSRAVLSTDPSGWYPSRLALVAHGRRVALAEGLSEAERRAVAAELARELGPARATTPTGPTAAVPGFPGAPVPITQVRQDCTWRDRTWP